MTRWGEINCPRCAELEAKLAQQDDLVQAAVAAALTEAAGVARLVRDTGDKAHALGIEENAAAYASAGEVIETRILDLITLDAQAALDRVVAAERGRIADLERRLKLWVPQNISETGRWPIREGGE
jgi:hypothetical protein